jgi:hypothetical protein
MLNGTLCEAVRARANLAIHREGADGHPRLLAVDGQPPRVDEGGSVTLGARDALGEIATDYHEP